jgi:hypothetical protein
MTQPYLLVPHVLSHAQQQKQQFTPPRAQHYQQQQQQQEEEEDECSALAHEQAAAAAATVATAAGEHTYQQTAAPTPTAGAAAAATPAVHTDSTGTQWGAVGAPRVVFVGVFMNVLGVTLAGHCAPGSQGAKYMVKELLLRGSAPLLPLRRYRAACGDGLVCNLLVDRKVSVVLQSA